MGKIVKIGDQRAIRIREGDVNVVVVNKYLVTVTGSAKADAKVAYARAVDLGRLSKCKPDLHQ